jgi:fructokinase
MTHPRLLVVGEVLVDLLPTRPDEHGSARQDAAMSLTGRFGGSPANVAVGLARLEAPVAFAGRLAGRGYGPWLRSHLAAEKVDLDLSVDADEPCTLAVVTIDDAGVASYEFYGPDTADWAWTPDELPPAATLAGGCVHTGSLATGLEPGAGVIGAWLRELRRQGDVAISYDPNIRPSLLGDVDLVGSVVAPALASAHLVKVSEEDLGVLYPGVAIDEIIAGWLAGEEGNHEEGPTLVVVTGGEAGARAWHADGRFVHRKAPKVTVVDTVGAGDAFTAGLLSSLQERGLLTPAGLVSISTDDLETAVDRGNRVASLTCTRPGADPPHRAELL